MFENFKTDNEIRVYLEEKINNIKSLDECRLYQNAPRKPLPLLGRG